MHNKEYLDILEKEFYLKEKEITIIPKRLIESIKLINGQIGPLKFDVSINVPLWLALKLKYHEYCRIVIPREYDEKMLLLYIEREKLEKENLAGDVPYHFFEWFKLLKDQLKDEIPNLPQMNRLVEELKTLRYLKVGNILKNLEIKEDLIFIDNLTFLDLQLVKILIKTPLDEIDKQKINE